ncbi:polyribonucleotide nucleotidyltransferase [bacterium]|nr:polyribonucleotide nucleotidyltransferase [bacterium]|tara:strand:- start:1200 stop:3275 length:2076 start_codon:yes stop_codon:yes gene_type:complete
MDLERKIYKTEVDDAPFELEISNLAVQANGAVLGRWGNTSVLVTAVMGGESSLPYFPLTVDYEERFYAAGQILGSRFVRREGRPSDEATLSARLLDRTIRPLFDHRLRREIQVVVTVLEYDKEHDPELIALVAASCALGISDIPWNGPVGAARFEKKSKEEELEYLAFFAGTENRVNMIEFEGNESSEAEAVELFEKGEKQIQELVKFQKKIIKEIGKKKTEVQLPETDKRIAGEVEKFLKSKLTGTFKKGELYALKDELMDVLVGAGEEPDALHEAEDIFEHEVDAYVHTEALENDRRIDGRKLQEIRDLHAEVGLFERVHGTGLFVRGDTQVLAAATLGPPSADQIVETMKTQEKKRFMLHYNFPSFSVGEAGRAHGPGRRDIGHGYLAFKALRAMLPSKEEFPYVIRIVAETLSSNGSSSMASTCAGCLSMLDAGVPLKKLVAGIAMGLMVSKDGDYKVLTDIQGPEDYHGDMDFKVAGTEDGITAIQMDVKIDGVTKDMYVDALDEAKKARLQILEVMKKTIAKPNELSQYAPRIITTKIAPDKIGELIGPGGKVINGILEQFDNEATIDIEDDGTVYIGAESGEIGDKVLAMVEAVVKEYEVGEIVEGPIVRVMEFGAIVDLGSGRDGMIHVSELKEGFVKNVEDVVKMGDKVKAKIVKVDNGKIGLSLKAMKVEEKRKDEKKGEK